MKRICIILISLLCMVFSSTAHNFQARHDILAERNYYNPATTALDPGMYLKAYCQYDFNVPALSGKNPLEPGLDFFYVDGNRSIFANFNFEGSSFFKGYNINGGYNYKWSRIGNSDHSLSIGGRFNMSFCRLDLGSLAYGEKGIKTLVAPDFDLGLEYQYKNFYLGIGVKNVLGQTGKYNGVQYVQWPRSFLITARGDISLAGDKVLLQPFAMLGIYQNVQTYLGLDFTYGKFLRIGYNINVLELGSNINISGTIARRVTIFAGCSVSPAHKYISTHGGITVRLDRKR